MHQFGKGIRLAAQALTYRVQSGQLRERLQAQVVQKLARGGKQGGPSRRFAVANHFDPTPVFQLLNQQGIDGYTPNIFHITARDRLAVGDDGQGFQGGAGVARGFFGVQAV